MPRKRGLRKKSYPVEPTLVLCDRSRPYLSVSCDGAGVPHEPWNIATFVRMPDGTWTEQMDGYTPPEGEFLLPRGPRVFQWLVDTKWVPDPRQGMTAGISDSAELRRRGRFECRHGCVAVPPIRFERWVEKLEAEHNRGVSHLLLGEVASRVLSD